LETAGGESCASFARGGKIVRADFIGTDETDTPRVHVDPNYERLKHHREEGTEDRRLCHIVLIFDES
jgi:hypothetical protein